MTSPYDYTQKAASACYITDSLVRVTPLPGGGQAYEYRHSNGLLSAMLVPPPGFDPVNATAAQLEEYGLPARPSSLAALVEWQNEMSRAWWATPASFIAELSASFATEVGSRAQSGAVPLSSPNQAGWGAAIAGNYGSSASVTYTEPSFPTTCSNPGDAVWGGLASYGSGSVFGQDGTLSDYSTGPDEAFWQVWAGNSIDGTNEDVGYIPTNDVVRANVNYPANEFTGTITDVTSGQVWGWSFGVFGVPPTEGAAVVEQPQGYSLPNFGTVNFSAISLDGTSLYNESWGTITPPDGSMSPSSSVGKNGNSSVAWNHC